MIPSPTKDFHDCYNQLLEELFHCNYELMSPLQFKQYVVNQRVYGWKVLSNLKKSQSSFSDMINKGRSGYGQNVIKYSVKDGSTKYYTAKDVARMEIP